MPLFQIKDKDDSQPIKETHYYGWLVENNVQDVHSIKTKTQYLEEQGFVVGTDRLEEGDIQRLKAIETVYYRILND